MKLVIPTNDNNGSNGKIAEHFGRCHTYTFLNDSGEVVKIIDNSSEHMGGVDLPPELMKKHGADILLCKGIGPRAIDLCKKLKIEVYVHQSDLVKDIFQLWNNDNLEKANVEDACEQHK